MLRFNLDYFLKTDLQICIDLPTSLKDFFKEKIIYSIYAEVAEFNASPFVKDKIVPARFYDWFVYQNSAIPLEVMYYLAKKFKVNFNEIEQQIIFYKQKHVPAKNSIKNPNLPIQMHPYFTSIIANLIFDGSVPVDGKGTYYNQKNKEIMNDFIEKLKFIFGDVFYSLRLDHKKVLACRVPRIIGEICRLTYKVNSFGTFDSRVPEIIFNLSDEHKIAFVLTALIDEGSIAYDGRITFGVCNKLLCEDVKKLCAGLNLETTEVTKKSKSNYYYFCIKSKEKLLKTINFINKKYPLISLEYKEKRLLHYFETKKCSGLHTKAFGDLRKEKILACLENNSLSINQLSVKLLVPPKSLSRHLSVLLDSKKINKKKSGCEYFYYLIPN